MSSGRQTGSGSNPHHPCAKCGASDTHSLRNATLYYCSDCLIAATKKRVRTALLEALSNRSLDMQCRLAVGVSTPGWSASSGWCAWHVLRHHVSWYKGQVGLNVDALFVRVLEEGDGDGDGDGDGERDREEDLEEDGGGERGRDSADRVIDVDGRALATVADPTGKEDLRRVLIRHALREELACGDRRYDCTLLPVR